MPIDYASLMGRDPEGQLAAGRGRHLWGHRHALGKARCGSIKRIANGLQAL